MSPNPRPRLSRQWPDRQERYDVVIVGSGYGGGVSASRLARAGKRVAVLERGSEILPGEFPSRFSDLKNHVTITSDSKTTSPNNALYDVRLGDDMHIVVGCGVGGGSLVNGGVALRPDERVFLDDAWPPQLSNCPRLHEGFNRADNWLRPARHKDVSDDSKYRALQKTANQLGHQFFDTSLTVSFENTVNAAGIDQPACTLCGDCCGGCNVGAKNTVATTYLQDAVNHGAEIFANVSVSHIQKTSDNRWQIFATTSCPDKKESVLDDLQADIVILAAGTLGSTEILLRSEKNGLACSHQLGQRFSANGDIFAFGYGSDHPINGVGVGYPAKVDDITVGAVVSGHIEISDTKDFTKSICVQGGVIPSALAPILPVLFLPNGRLLGALQSLIKGVYRGPFARLQTYFAVAHDSANGRLKLENNNIQLVWPNVANEPVYKKLDDVLSSIVTTTGGDYVKHPLSGTAFGQKPVTAHPLGGCAMAENAAHGVVNHKSQVYDTEHGQDGTTVHQGLYVIDGSIIPRSLGVNPLMTITALSERAMIFMAEDYQLSFDCQPVA